MEEVRIKYMNGKSIEITKNGRTYTIKLTTGKTVQMKYLRGEYVCNTRARRKDEQKQIRMAKRIISLVNSWI